jgi:predicted Zn-dependent protease with MMP-like domain
MFTISQNEFQDIINVSIQSLPKAYIDRLENVAFIVEDYPTPAQRKQLELRNDQTLFGLYEGVPLSRRQGTTKLLPDKITIFKDPIEFVSNNLAELRTQVAKTVWHEVAHYYGLNHDQINALNSKAKG